MASPSSRTILRGGLRRIVDDVSAYYVLGYYSTDRNFNGGYRRIDVKVARPGVQVRARRGYYAPKGAMPTAETAKPAVAAPPAGLTDALGVLARLRADVEPLRARRDRRRRGAARRSSWATAS